MHLQSLLLAPMTLTAIAYASLLEGPAQVKPLAPRQSSNSEEAYLNSVCTPPNIANAPCQVINDIESACQPNGTATIDFIAHQECMCGGGFFNNWFGCLNCLYVHGGRSQAQSIAFSQILTSASNSLCTGTPTADFAAIFASLTNAAPAVPSTAGTSTSDEYPSQAAVSLYYTASGPQGPGPITGSAAQATTKIMSSGSGSASTGKNTVASSTSGAAATLATNSAATSKTSTGGAAATNIYGGLFGVAGGVFMAAI